MAARCTEAELRAKVEEMAALAGIGPISVVFPPALEREHQRDDRRYAQVDLPRRRFEFARSILDLEPVYREGLIAHEVGHVIADQRGLASSEEEADRMAALVLGIEIAYDRSWPGKGLQMNANPMHRNAPSIVPFPEGRSLGDYNEDGTWDCRHAFSINEFQAEMDRFPIGRPGGDPNAIFERVMTKEFKDEYFEDWVDTQEGLDGHPRAREAFDAWAAGWKFCGVQRLRDRQIERWHQILGEADLFYVLDPEGVELDRFDNLEEALRVLSRMPVESTLEMEVEGERGTRAVLAAIDPEYDTLHMQLHPLYTLPVHGYPVGDRLGAFSEMRRAAKKAGIANPSRNPSRSRDPNVRRSSPSLDALKGNPKSLSDWAEKDEVYRFTKAMLDPDPSSIAVAQDILLESGVAHALWIIGDDVFNGQRDNNETPGPQALLEQRYGAVEGRKMMLVDQGMFRFAFQYDGDEVDNRVTWVLTKLLHRGVDKGYRASYWFRYGAEPNRRQRVAGVQDPLTAELNLGSATNSDDARGRAARYAWAAFAIMKESLADGLTGQQMMQRVLVFANDREKDIPTELNPAMKQNPGKKQDVEDARAKYEEFHRYAPKKEIFESSFKIPTRLLCAGKSKWVTYRSGKVDPATLKKPKHPVDYIHEHNAGVHTYIPDKNPDTEVPEDFRQVGALTRLGFCLGFCIETDEGEVEAEATDDGGMPELYSTPDGKCLLVIQSRKKVLAMMWGGGLGVFARGIDG